MKVVVENLTGTLFYVQVGNDATVAELKSEIEAQEKLPCDRLILILDSNDIDSRQIIEDGSGLSLGDHGVHDGSHIYILFKPLDDGAPSSSSHSFDFTLPDCLWWW